MQASERDRRTIAVAAEIAGLVEAGGGRAAIIGAAALAVHGYARATRDVDLATELDPFTQMREIERMCHERGYDATLVLPDADDPLGGVLTVRGEDFDPVQLVNFANPFSHTPTPAHDALLEAVPLHPGAELRVVTAPHLIALKLYAGGLRSRADVVALMEANPAIDREQLRALCRKHGLHDELERALAEA